MSQMTTFTAPLWAIAAAVLSGGVSAIALDPVMQAVETLGLDDLFGLLSTFAITAGLAFGLLGGAVLLKVAKLPPRVVAVFMGTSMIGMAAAVYVAMISFNNTTENFVTSYAIGSPLGALIVVVPLAFLGPLVHPWRWIAIATVLPTLWAMAVAATFPGDAAMEVPGLAALYIGWQAIVLTTFVMARRRA